MFTDARDLPERSTVQADVCVIGAGAAGIALALDFVDTPVRVVLLESGGSWRSPTDGEPIESSPAPLRDSPSIRGICEIFKSQRTKQWFTADTFRALMRLRGVEVNDAFAEAFYGRKLTLG